MASISALQCMSGGNCRLQLVQAPESSSSSKTTWFRGSSSSSSIGSWKSSKSMENKTTPLPKFGDWDKSDSRSSENITQQFDRYKEERREQSLTLSRPPPNNPPTSYQSASFWSKIFCCVFPRAE
ncbi:Pathogenic type III effector avirulence factor Avr cleavage site [Corchorus capsularis]|uniref:Pathogenic type III effector avirulence factor Avr cleavage site n=1 Tax=Corchorus capsularis TaxID=210143 RepID=A0A1R3I2Q4_COCAP|nr:Pathogenic type III effector avirulence factor Avr cleavage site [Corchorus capsularis]